MLVIDGSRGEGGGQILRTALALSLVTRTPFRIEKLRARRSKPGLMRQHLTGAQAAAQIGDAELVGGEVGSQTLELRPRDLRAGDYRFTVGTAGSAGLVLQTVLPALMNASGPSTLVIEGGTHNRAAPSYHYLERVYLPLLARMGVRAEPSLERYGFYPAGGGRIRVALSPTEKLAPLELLRRGEVRARRAQALLCNLPFDIVRRELAVVRHVLKWDEAACAPREITDADGPGNVVQLEVESEHVTELFTGFGEKGFSAESVATTAATEAAEYLAADVPVGPHLADQLLLPMALAGRGAFRSLAPTEHTRTQIDTIRRFIAIKIRAEQVNERAWHYEVG